MTIADTSAPAATRGKARLTERQQTAAILMTVLLIVAAWGLSFATWGIPGLYVPAVAMVPVVLACLILITVGK